MRTRHALALLATATVLAAPVAAQAAPYQHTPQAVATGTGGAAATVDAPPRSAAIDVLRHGGNAVDAAVAAAAVLGVIEPYSCGIGGGGFMVDLRTPRRARHHDRLRETAPAAMTPDSFCENGKPLDFDDARYSGLSVGVPGTCATGQTRAAALRHDARSPTCSARRSRSPRGGFVVDQTFSSRSTPQQPTGSTTSRPPRRCTSTRTARRATSARRLTQPGPRRDATSGSRSAGRRRSTAARSRRRSSHAVAAPADARRRRPRRGGPA